MDGDGNLDILSGSWPGELYFFRGEGKLGGGKFAKAETLKDKDGKAINLGGASTAFAFDWTGDGRLDLLVGCVAGQVFLVPNESGTPALAFGKPQKLSAEGKEIAAPHGDSHPLVTDWNRDGNPDLIVAAGDGSVSWYRNVGRKTEPKLEAGRILLDAPPRADGVKAGRGTRAKVCVADYNGDGKPDLLVGDFSYSMGEAPKLTEADEAAKKQAEEKYQKVIKELQPYFEEIQKHGRAPEDATARAEWSKKATEIREKYKKGFEELSAASREMQKYRQPFNYNGFVWVLTAETR